MKFSSRMLGFFQAAALALYVSLFALTGQQFQQWFAAQNFQFQPVVGIVLFLLAFIISALICGSIAFGYPIFFFFGNKKGEAIKLVLWTMVWLSLLFLIFLLVSLIAFQPSPDMFRP